MNLFLCKIQIEADRYYGRENWQETKLISNLMLEV